MQDIFIDVKDLAIKCKRISLKNQDEFIIIGRSLGGVLAGIISAKLNIASVAIGSPGTRHILKRYNINNDEELHSSLTNIIFDNDLVTKLTNLGFNKFVWVLEYNDKRLCHDPNALTL